APALHAHAGWLQDARHPGLRPRRSHHRFGCRVRRDAGPLGSFRAHDGWHLEARLRLRDAAGRQAHPAGADSVNFTGFAPAHRLDGRTAVIAGGLGAVGRATAARFAGAGARVVLLHRKGEPEAEAFASTLPGSGHYGVRASITDSPSLAAAAAEVQANSAAVHILVNTAGFTRPVAIGDLDA